MPRARSSPAELAVDRWPYGVPGTHPIEVQQAVLAAGEFASAVRHARRQRKWSRAALGRKAGLSSHVVGNVEDGHGWPDLITMSSLAKALGMSVRLMALSSDEAVAVTQALAAAARGAPPNSAAAGQSPEVAARAVAALLAAWPGLREQYELLRRRPST